MRLAYKQQPPFFLVKTCLALTFYAFVPPMNSVTYSYKPNISRINIKIGLLTG